MKNIYLDDLRTPPANKQWVVLRSSQEAIDYVKKHGMSDYWSFDHDLGGDDTTMVFLKWLVEYDLDNDGKTMGSAFHYDVHSANPVGVKNISGLLDSYMIFKTKRK